MAACAGDRLLVGLAAAGIAAGAAVGAASNAAADTGADAGAAWTRREPEAADTRPTPPGPSGDFCLAKTSPELPDASTRNASDAFTRMPLPLALPPDSTTPPSAALGSTGALTAPTSCCTLELLPALPVDAFPAASKLPAPPAAPPTSGDAAWLRLLAATCGLFGPPPVRPLRAYTARKLVSRPDGCAPEAPPVPNDPSRAPRPEFDSWP